VPEYEYDPEGKVLLVKSEGGDYKLYPTTQGYTTTKPSKEQKKKINEELEKKKKMKQQQYEQLEKHSRKQELRNLKVDHTSNPSFYSPHQKV